MGQIVLSVGGEGCWSECRHQKRQLINGSDGWTDAFSNVAREKPHHHDAVLGVEGLGSLVRPTE